jgi:AcrR family transcriptional regulator
VTREPVQARGRARRDGVLDAASRLIDRHGKALSTTELAREAGVAVGTIYQYFDGLDAVIEAVVRRHLDRFDQIILDTLAADEHPDLTRATLAVVHAFVRYYRDEPGFRALWFGPELGARYRQLDQANNARLAETMYDGLVSRDLIPRSTRTLTYLRANWEIADTLIALAFQRSPKGDRTILDYLDHVLRLLTATRPPGNGRGTRSTSPNRWRS